MTNEPNPVRNNDSTNHGMIHRSGVSNGTKIEAIVMRRVQRIQYLRPVISMGTLSVLLFAIALYGIGREVWVAQVLENMPPTGDWAAVSEFFIAAFDNTRLTVQALSLLAFLSLIYLARASARFITSALIPARA